MQQQELELQPTHNLFDDCLWTNSPYRLISGFQVSGKAEVVNDYYHPQRGEEGTRIYWKTLNDFKFFLKINGLSKGLKWIKKLQSFG